MYRIEILIFICCLSSCANNFVEGLSQAIVLLPLDLPSPPHGITVQQTSNCSVLLSWQTPFSTDPLRAVADALVVEQQVSGSSQQWELIDTLPANQTSLNVSLLPDKEYRFRIASSSEVGRGESVEAPQAVSSSVVGEYMGSV